LTLSVAQLLPFLSSMALPCGKSNERTRIVKNYS
jgi:hypothetical protein